MTLILILIYYNKNDDAVTIIVVFLLALGVSTTCKAGLSFDLLLLFLGHYSKYCIIVQINSNFISYREKNDMIEYHFSIISKFLKLAIFYILFINNQSSKHTKRRSQLSLIIFYSNNGHKSRQEH
jgi:hypothetical protein